MHCISLQLWVGPESQVDPGKWQQDQSFQENYRAIFHFQFWQYGEWVEVVVDDRLPTKDGELLFLHSEEGSEFWSALLEKAYAKEKPKKSRLNSSYEALAGGSTVEGFEDFTGGISEFYELKKPPASLFQIIWKALRAGSLLACSSDVSSAAAAEAITSLKLVKSHAYSVTGVEEVDFRGHPEKLIRLRNPSGEVEWMGAWSDVALEWNYVDPRQKEKLDKKADNGEFWMSFSDFLRCWIRGSTAGGCQNYPATYWTNPQFKICLDEVDDHQEESTGEPCCTVLLGLMQKNRRRQKRMGQGMLSIGHAVYKLESHTDEHLGRDFFLSRQPSARYSTYVNLREYAVVPSTFGPFKDGDFCLRGVFSEKKAKALGVSFPSGVAGVTEGPGSAQPHPSEVDQEDGQLRSLFEKLAGKGHQRSLGCEIQVGPGAGTAQGPMEPGEDAEKEPREEERICRVFGSLLPWLSGVGKEIYQETDYNHSGTIDAHEMRTALKKAGRGEGAVRRRRGEPAAAEASVTLQQPEARRAVFTPPTPVLSLRSDRSPSLGSQSPPAPAGFTFNNQVQQTIAMRYACSKLDIDFDSFLACMIRLETLFKLFSLLDKDQNGIVRLSLAEWLCCVLV
ncbi:hypothetical protein J1605_015585 [Eschrichtius robustus]|uniref:Calpain-8 n=1 Tax=Eschrichtius robustus TaxID=9764 RepID=A0AB34GAX6_ESCRO|nr:hypothetical protein J1605_015585 [Eschrichtius robustus]